jgi:hypothetical protein
MRSPKRRILRTYHESSAGAFAFQGLRNGAGQSKKELHMVFYGQPLGGIAQQFDPNAYQQAGPSAKTSCTINDQVAEITAGCIPWWKTSGASAIVFSAPSVRGEGRSQHLDRWQCFGQP